MKLEVFFRVDLSKITKIAFTRKAFTDKSDIFADKTDVINKAQNFPAHNSIFKYYGL